MRFGSDLSIDQRCEAAENFLEASAGEVSMMARCTGKTNIHNLEPEDLRSITLATATATGIPLIGNQAVSDQQSAFGSAGFPEAEG